MSRTVTALFDTRADAEAAKQRLLAANIDADNVHVHDQSSMGSSYGSTGSTASSTTGGTTGSSYGSTTDASYGSTGSSHGYSTHGNRGFWDSVKHAFLPDEDRHTYEEGVRRGGALLTADVDDDEVDEAVRVLEESNTIDIDDRSNQWRQSGWDYAGTGAMGAATGAAYGSTTSSTTGGEGFIGSGARGTTEGEQVIPVVEEELIVGKREVERGGARVRSYVSEIPVHEQIRLRNERVSVERRAVDQPLSAADADAFREREINVTARGEEAVVAKEARVVEEVVVRKTADEETRTIDDTVRRTDVEVDEGTTGTTGFTGRDRDRDGLL